MYIFYYEVKKNKIQNNVCELTVNIIFNVSTLCYRLHFHIDTLCFNIGQAGTHKENNLLNGHA